MTTIWRMGIVTYGEAAPEDLTPHPLNPRDHPEQQRVVVQESIDLVGLIDLIVVNMRTGRILNGHLRRELALASQQPSVPVVYVDVALEDEPLALAAFDRMAELARVDPAKQSALLADLPDLPQTLQETLNTWARETGAQQRLAELGTPALDALAAGGNGGGGGSGPGGPTFAVDVLIQVGSYSQLIPAPVFDPWLEQLRDSCEQDSKQVRAECLRRLGFT